MPTLLADHKQTHIINDTNSNTVSRCSKLHVSFAAIALLALVELTVIIWIAFDHSTPCWDTAMHRMNSLAVYDYLQYPQFNTIKWYKHIFAVSQLYPPFFYFISAGLKYVCGETANTEFIANLGFIAIMFFSVYYSAKTLFKNELAGATAAVLVFFYPAVFWTTHNALLDCSANAMVALGLAYFFWWTNKPTIFRSITLGIVLGLTCLTKNNTPIFFLGPVLTEVLYALKKQDDGRRNLTKMKQLCLVAFVSFLVILPWVVLAGPSVIKFVNSVQTQDFGIRDRLAEFILNLQLFTTVDFPAIVSPLLFSAFLVAIFIPNPLTKNRFYLLSSVVCSIIAASCFRWPHQFRYIVPAAIPAAILTADMLAYAWSRRKLFLRIVLILVAAVAILQVLYVGFNPYPIHVSGFIRKLMRLVGEDFKIDDRHSNIQSISIHPLPQGDWGVNWALSIVEKNSNGKKPSLMVMPNTDSVNCSPYIYVARMKGFNTYLGSSREYTELGDNVSFKSNIANWYGWYILKTGDQGLKINNAKSTAAYEQWCQYIRSSGNYRLFASKKLPDQGTLELYKRSKE